LPIFDANHIAKFMTNLKYLAPESFSDVVALDAPMRQRAALFADMCRLNTLYMIKCAGSGHIGTSFSALDIISFLYLTRTMGDARSTGEHDLFFSSKGHDVPGHYSVMIALGLLHFDLVHQLRQIDGLPGHPDIGTPNILTNTGSLGMGVSKAKGFLKAAALDGRPLRNVFVLTGDGELQEGQFWESLSGAANGELGRLIVIVDHNKIQSDTLVSLVSDLGDLEAKFNAFGWHVRRCDGHDIDQIEDAVTSAIREKSRPSVILADTIKGRGVSFMEASGSETLDDLYHYHSGAPTDEEYRSATDELYGRVSDGFVALGLEVPELRATPAPAAAPPSPGSQRLVRAYAEALREAAARNPNIVVLDADLMLDCGLIPFRKTFPDRFVECGIAEQDMVSQAGAMALAGKLPVAHSFSCFLSTRPNEQIYNNATEKTKIIYTAPLSGVVPGGPGHSHQSVRDISALSAIPGLVLLEPATEAEVYSTLDHCVDPRNPSSYFLRLVSVPWGIEFGDSFQSGMIEGRGAVIHHGNDAILVSYGPVMLSQAFSCAKALEKQRGLRLTVVNLPWLNRIDGDWLAETVGDARVLFTLDNHYVRGGQGEMIAAAVARRPDLRHVTVHSFGLEEIPACGGNEAVLAHHGLDSASLAARIGEILRVAGK